MEIDLRQPLTLGRALRFPLQSAAARRDVLVGGLWLLVPVVGWLLNMGHRVRVVHRLQRGEDPWPAWTDTGDLLRHGIITFAGMVWYGWPGVGLTATGLFLDSTAILAVGLVLWLVAVLAIPGYMSHYCKEFDPSEVFNPVRALGRVVQGGPAYWKAWSVAIVGMVLSFLGLLALGVGFVFTSVWFWQAAAFSFATVFTRRFNLDGGLDGGAT